MNARQLNNFLTEKKYLRGMLTITLRFTLIGHTVHMKCFKGSPYSCKQWKGNLVGHPGDAQDGKENNTENQVFMENILTIWKQQT